MERCVVLLAVLSLLLVGMAAAADDIEVQGYWVVVAWDPSRGLPTHYAVFVSRNGGGFPSLPEHVTPTTQRAAILGGSHGDVISVRIAAFDKVTRSVSAYSEVSPPIRFFDPSRGDPWASAPSLLANGSFEEGDDPGAFRRLPGDSTLLPGWEVIGHSVDWVGSAWKARDGSHSLDLNGGAPGGIRQSFATEPGRRYALVLSFAGNPLGGAPRKALSVQVAGTRHDYVFDATGRTTEDMGWYSPWPLVFQADAAQTTLELWSADPADTSGFGPTLDSVAVHPVR